MKSFFKTAKKKNICCNNKCKGFKIFQKNKITFQQERRNKDEKKFIKKQKHQKKIDGRCFGKKYNGWSKKSVVIKK